MTSAIDAVRPVTSTAKLFIAYSFRSEGQAVVDEIIRPVLDEQGVQCVTGREHAASAGDDVASVLRGMIANCSALVAVVTGCNPNVFFEIGVASALSKPCLLLASRASDAAMLQGTYPIIGIAPPGQAMNELKRHLSLWRLAKKPII